MPLPTLLAQALSPASPADWAGLRLGGPPCDLCTDCGKDSEGQIHIYHLLLPSQRDSISLLSTDEDDEAAGRGQGN